MLWLEFPFLNGKLLLIWMDTIDSSGDIQNMNRNLIFFGLLGLAGFFIYKRYNKKDDLQVHLLEVKAMQEVGQGVVQTDTAALNQYPLTTIGDTPLAGIQYDPFNITSPASDPKPLDLFPGNVKF